MTPDQRLFYHLGVARGISRAEELIASVAYRYVVCARSDPPELRIVLAEIAEALRTLRVLSGDDGEREGPIK